MVFWFSDYGGSIPPPPANTTDMKKTISGRITADGCLALCMGELNEYTAKYKGQRVIVTIEPIGATSEAMRRYYFGYVVPTFKAAIWNAGERLTDVQTERRLRELSPIMYEQKADEDGVYSTRLRTISELTNEELSEHIETLKQIAAEEFSAYINDPADFR